MIEAFTDARFMGGVAVALAIAWFLIRDHRRKPEVLPPPDKACERNPVEAVL